MTSAACSEIFSEKIEGLEGLSLCVEWIKRHEYTSDFATLLTGSLPLLASAPTLKGNADKPKCESLQGLITDNAYGLPVKEVAVAMVGRTVIFSLSLK
jgi:hypothetical protein